MKTILVTGHEGLIGRALLPELHKHGFNVNGLDLVAFKDEWKGDITESERLRDAIYGCHGIIHLAAVSRVVWGENNPDLCWATNATASINLLKFAAESHLKPWVLVCSSREVYGEAPSLPVKENDKLMPINVYGWSKYAMEKATESIQQEGINTAIVRLSNVYGDLNDHQDRVLPAFCRAAAYSDTLRIDGEENTFDFTHITDTISGLIKIVEKLNRNEKLPPLHLLTGIPTTLREAANMAILAAKSSSGITKNSARKYDVSRFVGDTSRTKQILGWKAKISVEQGIEMLIKLYSKG